VVTATTQPAAEAPGPTPASAPFTYSSTLPRTTRIALLVAVTLATCMEFLTSYAIGVALPDIQGDLSASIDQGSWILTTYSTCFLIGLVLSNWIASRIGFRRHMATAIVLYMFAAIGCARSHTLTEMIIFRAAMGYAGGSFLVRAQTAINLAFSGKARFKAMLLFAFGVVCTARLSGAAVGGYLTEWYSWRAIFLLNVPMALSALTLLVLVLPDVKEQLSERARRLDAVGFALLVAWVVSLQLALSRGERDDWFNDPFIASLAVAFALCFPLFIWWELLGRERGTAPIISQRTFQSRTFVIGAIYVVVLGMMLYGQLYVVPQFLRNVQHHSAWGTGKLQGFNAVAFAVGLVLGAWLMRPIGIRCALAVGAATFTAGMWTWATRLTPDISDRAMLLPLALTGFGAGWQIGPLSTLINKDTPDPLMGEGMELYLCLRQLGGSWGTAILAILVDRRESLWSGRLGEHLSEYEIAGGAPSVAGDALQLGTAALQAAGLPHADAQAGAMALLHGRLLTQTFVNAFADTFVYQAGLGVFALLLTVCLGRGELVKRAWRWIAAGKRPAGPVAPSRLPV
jgi:DHA2 family multidrug resistance protein